MTVAEGKAAVQSYFEEFLNRGNLTSADVIFATDVRFHYPLGDLNGVEAVKTYIAAVRTAFPDVRFTIEDLFGEGDRVAARWWLAGTQTGVIRGKPPTGKGVKLSGNTIFRISNGRIGEYGSRSTLRVWHKVVHAEPPVASDRSSLRSQWRLNRT